MSALRRSPPRPRPATKALAALALLATVLALATPTARAGFVVFELDKVDSGSTPDGDPLGPWLRARFEDSGTPGEVILTLTSLLENGNSLKGNKNANNVAWGFNLNPLLLAEDLKIEEDAPSSTNLADSVFPITNGVDVPSPKQFDLGFSWDESDRFEGSDVAVYKITLKGGGSLTAKDFNYANPDGFYSYAHVQEIGKDSGKIYDGDGGEITDTEVHPTPEPSGVVLAGLGAFGLLALRRKFFARPARP